MSIFVQPTLAPVPRTNDVRRIATFYAGVLVVMIVAQLFTFESFITLVESFNFPGGAGYAHFLTAFLIVVELLALPFLLRMSLSPALRWMSMICGWLAALIWAKITIWLVVQESLVSNVGLLGTVVDMMPGWWAILISLSLGILAAWASWGMWPHQHVAKRVKKHRK